MKSKFKNIIQGSCHCGNINLALHTDRDSSEFTPRNCQCTFCRKHAASWISDPEGEVELRFRNREEASFYQWNTKTSHFICCKNCGVLMIATCQLEDRLRAVINITPFLDEKFTAAPMNTDFDDEDLESRLERRRKNWTGNVIITEQDSQ